MDEEIKSCDRPVCVFDSGTGGLNLLAACVRACPERDFIYFADNYNVPYGNMSRAHVRELVLDIFERIAKCNPAAAVVACNTVTALCISELRSMYSFPVVGIQPAVKQAAGTGGECLVLATKATAESEAFKNLCSRWLGDRARVTACGELAKYIEENIFSYPHIDVSRFLPDCNPSSVVLGCTHYIFVRDFISEYYKCPVFDGILGTADHLRLLLGNSHENSKSKRIIQFKCGDSEKNEQIFNILMNKNYTD